MNISTNYAALGFKSLYFTEKGANAMKKDPSAYRNEEIKKAMETVKDTTTYNVEITTIPNIMNGETLTARIVSPFANKYLPPYSITPATSPDNKDICVNAKWDGTESDNLKKGDDYRIYLNYDSEEDAKAAVERMKSSDYAKAAEIAKQLDSQHQKKERMAAEAQQRREELNQETVNLIVEAGVRESA